MNELSEGDAGLVSDDRATSVSEARLHTSHTWAYVCAKGIPGLLAFLAIPIFTFLMSPREYSSYAFSIASVNVANALIFQWVRVAIVRVAPSEDDAFSHFYSTVLMLWVLLVGVTGFIAVPIFLLVGTNEGRLIVACSWLTTCAQALFDYVAEIDRARLRPWRYMVEQSLRSAVLVLGGGLALFYGSGWSGPLIVLSTAMVLMSVSIILLERRKILPRFGKIAARNMFTYGIPVSLTVGLGSAVYLTDRSLIAAFINQSQAGVYSVAFDFTNQTLMTVLLALSMSTLPIVLKLFNQCRRDEYAAALRRNISLLVALGLPATVGLMLLADKISSTVLGRGYEGAGEVIEIVALTAFLAGLKACHFDLAFQIEGKTLPQVAIVSVTLASNVLLNLFLIPQAGVLGAAWSSAICFGGSLIATAIYGRRYVKLPFPAASIAKSALSVVVMGLVLSLFGGSQGIAGLIGQITVGAFVYGLGIAACNPSRTRRYIWRILKVNPTPEEG